MVLAAGDLKNTYRALAMKSHEGRTHQRHALQEVRAARVAIVVLVATAFGLETCLQWLTLGAIEALQLAGVE